MLVVGVLELLGADPAPGDQLSAAHTIRLLSVLVGPSPTIRSMFDRLGRIVRRDRVKYYGDCPSCKHDWRDHPGWLLGTALDRAWRACQYEFDHEERRRRSPDVAGRLGSISSSYT